MALHFGHLTELNAIDRQVITGEAMIKPAKSLLLEVPADEPGDEVLGEGAWRRRPKRPPPERAKLVEAE